MHNPDLEIIKTGYFDNPAYFIQEGFLFNWISNMRLVSFISTIGNVDLNIQQKYP